MRRPTAKALMTLTFAFGALLVTGAWSQAHARKLRVVTRGLARKTRTYRIGGKKHYAVRLRLKGSRKELARIHTVIYELHRAYKQPQRVSRDSRSKFGVNIEAFGYFDMKVHIYRKDGSAETRIERVKFDPKKATDSQGSATRTHKRWWQR